MITFSKLGSMGRLGNQMFQIASIIGISKTIGTDYGFPTDWEYQFFFEKPLPKPSGPLTVTHINEHGFHFKSYAGSVISQADLHGYFQSPKYWEGNEEEVKSYFKLKQEVFHTVFENFLNIVKQIPPRKKLETVALHVRRGDYVDISQWHTDLSKTKYYELALKKLQGLLGYKNLSVVVFSDDIEFCKGYLTEPPFAEQVQCYFYFAPTTDPVIDLFTASLMDHFVIANSSFSWWAAYLAGNKKSYVVSPGDMIPWFGPKYDQNEYNTRDLIPKGWHQI